MASNEKLQYLINLEAASAVNSFGVAAGATTGAMMASAAPPPAPFAGGRGPLPLLVPALLIGGLLGGLFGRKK